MRFLDLPDEILEQTMSHAGSATDYMNVTLLSRRCYSVSRRVLDYMMWKHASEFGFAQYAFDMTQFPWGPDVEGAHQLQRNLARFGVRLCWLDNMIRGD